MAFTGAEASGGLSQALGVVTLAGLLLGLTLRAAGRRVLAVLLGLAGLGMCLLGALRLQPDPETVRTRVRQVSLVDQFALQTTAWPWVYVLAGGLLVATGILLWQSAPSWPERAGRFTRGSAATSPAADLADLADDPARAWQALDVGVDPTVAAPGEPPPAPRSGTDPDVRSESPGATMDARQGRPQHRSETATPADRRSEDP